MARQPRGQQTRDAVLAATADLIAGRSFAMITLSEIEQAAGVTKGALHGQFASKDAIAAELIDIEYRAAHHAVQRRLIGAPPSFEAVLIVMFESAHYIAENPRFQSAIRLRLELARSETWVDEAAWQQWHKFASRLVQRSIDAGDVKPSVDPSRFAFVMLSAMMGVRLMSDIIERHEQLIERVQDLLHLMLPGVVVADRVSHYEALAASRAVRDRQVLDSADA